MLMLAGFAALERPLHPVEEHEFDAVPFLHWPTRGRRGQEFTDEFYAIDAEPATVLAAVRSARPGPDHLIAEHSYAQPPDETAWTDAGYEFGSREPIMVANLVDSGLAIPSNMAIARLTRMSDAERILAAHAEAEYPQRLFTQALLDDPNLAIRVAWSDTGEFMAIGKAALLQKGAYITDVMTMPALRKRGIGRLIMQALHQDAVHAGCEIGVLTSTTMGKPLYESLGYREAGIQTLYATPERD